MSNQEKIRTYISSGDPLNPKFEEDIEINGENIGKLKLEFNFTGDEKYRDRLHLIIDEAIHILGLFSIKLEALYKFYDQIQDDISYTREQIISYYCYSDEEDRFLENLLGIKSTQDSLIFKFLKEYGPLALSTQLVINKVHEWLRYNQKDKLDKVIQALLEFKHNKPVDEILGKIGAPFSGVKKYGTTWIKDMYIEMRKIFDAHLT